jgi:hypothetical protein
MIDYATSESFASDTLVEFSDANRESFYLSCDPTPVDRLPADDFHENDYLNAANENSGIDNL